jgi:hypothetical protein
VTTRVNTATMASTAAMALNVLATFSTQRVQSTMQPPGGQGQFEPSGSLARYFSSVSKDSLMQFQYSAESGRVD